MKRLMSILFIALLPGCAVIPPFVSYITTGATALSYITTGKGTSDHLISVVYNKDCALHRVISNEDICTKFAKIVGPVDNFDDLQKQAQIDIGIE